LATTVRYCNGNPNRLHLYTTISFGYHENSKILTVFQQNLLYKNATLMSCWLCGFHHLKTKSTPGTDLRNNSKLIEFDVMLGIWHPEQI
jgi:hypothetical protein